MELLKRFGVALRYAGLMLDCQDFARRRRRKRLEESARKAMALARRHARDGIFELSEHRLTEELLIESCWTQVKDPDEVGSFAVPAPYEE